MVTLIGDFRWLCVPKSPMDADRGSEGRSTRSDGAMRVSWRAPAAFVGAIAAGWWLVGDLSETNRYRPGDLEYVLRAPEVPRFFAVAVACVGVAAVVAAAVSAVRAARVGRGHSSVLLGVTLAIVSGWLIAYCARVVTAGSIGANIGAGMAILFVGPFALAVLGVAIWKDNRPAPDGVTVD
jgi:hypothetical protein